MYNYDQAAEVLGVSARTVRRLVRTGELPAAKIGGARRIRPEAVRDYILESEQRMSDVSSSLVGNNRFGGGPRDVPTSTAFPGTGASNAAGSTDGPGAAWQSWQGGDDLVGDEPVTSGVVASGMVSGGIVTGESDPFPGFRPEGWGVGYGPDVPSWAKDSPHDGTDYDAPTDPATPRRARPWSSGQRPSDVGFTQAFYPEQSGQIPQGEPDSTGLTGDRVPRLRRDDGMPGAGVLP
jgi:excisionase family DNA binding protein